MFLEKKEAQDLVNLIEAVAKLKPREVIDRKYRTVAKKIDKKTQHIGCF